MFLSLPPLFLFQRFLYSGFKGAKLCCMYVYLVFISCDLNNIGHIGVELNVDFPIPGRPHKRIPSSFEICDFVKHEKPIDVSCPTDE